MEHIYIGNVKIEKTAALAPMASAADTAYRIMAKEYGASYCVSEMVSCKGICYSDKNTNKLLKITEKERPMAIQLFGAEPEFMEKAVKTVMDYKPDIIDINAGCPMPKIVNNGAGCALMRDTVLLGEIVAAAASVSKVPVTVKIRKGWDENSVNAVQAALTAEKNGASAVAVHGRTKDQLYSGKADWNIIKDVKSALSIPVIGNGDVDSAQKCKEMYDYTGCDLVMIGRGSCGRPWIFGRIKDYLEGKDPRPEPDTNEKLEIMRRHIALLIKFKGEYVGMKEARRQAAWYLKGMKGAARYRNICGTLKTPDDLEKLIMEIAEGEKNNGEL